MTPNTDVPDDDAPDTADEYSGYPYSLHNLKTIKIKLLPILMPPMLLMMMLPPPTLVSEISLLKVKWTPSQCLNFKKLKS